MAKRKNKRKAKRAYEAAQSKPYRRNVIGANLSQDAAADRAFPHLRQWGRYLDENHDLVVGILDELVKNIVGSGIVTIPAPLNADGQVNESLGRTIDQAWRSWIERADVTGELHWHEAQRLICRAWLRDGESFLQHVAGDAYPFMEGETPYRLQLLESDLVPWDYNDEDSGWRQGIRTDAWRRPIEYAVYRTHPGELGIGFGTPVTFDDLQRVSADVISHVKHVRRWPATRGISALHAVITRLYDVMDLEESERIKNRVLASWTAAIKKSPDIPGVEVTDDSGKRYLEMMGGAIIDTLAPGEEIVGVGPEYPVAGLNDYLADQMRRIASGTGTRYSSISKHYDGSYSAQRQEMVETEGLYQMRTDTFIAKVCKVVYRRWLLSAFPAFVTPSMDAWERISNAEYRGPVTPWIDPLKEVNADIAAINNDLVTLEQVQTKRGMAPELIGKSPNRDAAAANAAQLELLPADEDAA